MQILHDEGPTLLVTECQADGTLTVKYYELQETLTLRVEEWEEYTGLRTRERVHVAGGASSVSPGRAASGRRRA